MEELNKIINQNNDMKQRLKNYIPRRRVRRVYKMLRKILESDIDNSEHIIILKEFIKNIEKNGTAIAGQEIKTAIEYLLSIRDRED